MRVPVVFYFAMREAKKNYRFHFFIAEAVVHTKEKRAEQALLEQYTQTLENRPAVSGTMVQLLPVLDINTNLDYDA